ncbi:MAG: hypothetical protein WBB74_08965, partial [Gaiellaceae bacterium]
MCGFGGGGGGGAFRVGIGHGRLVGPCEQLLDLVAAGDLAFEPREGVPDLYGPLAGGAGQVVPGHLHLIREGARLLLAEAQGA